MYTVRNSEGVIVLVTSRKEDAISAADSTSLDQTEYTITYSTIIKPNETTEGEDENKS
tara:strand:+ start:1340 stop:1513 length:174 start_codon:yes stop_codon:yes gene_type:complete